MYICTSILTNTYAIHLICQMSTLHSIKVETFDSSHRRSEVLKATRRRSINGKTFDECILNLPPSRTSTIKSKSILKWGFYHGINIYVNCMKLDSKFVNTTCLIEFQCQRSYHACSNLYHILRVQSLSLEFDH